MRDFVLETVFFFFFILNLLKNIMLCGVSCFQWFKDTNLKANHNTLKIGVTGTAAVSNGSKILI